MIEPMRSLPGIRLPTPLGLALALSLTAPNGQGQESTPPPDPEQFAAVDAWLAQLVTDRVVPGTSLVILTRDDGVVHESKHGTGDLDAVLPIASATKLTGATVAAILAERDLVDLEASVGEHLPGFGDRAPTLAQCLSCTSGLAQSGMFVARHAETLEAGVAAIAATTQRRFLRPKAPGLSFHYGGAGFQVAGRTLEVAAGKPFVALFDELVAEPLGLTTWEFGRSTTNPDLGGGARCSVRDYARFLAMHLGDGAVGDVRLMTTESARAMRDDRRGQLPLDSTPYPPALGYGLAWWILPPDDGKESPHLFADPGAFGATPWIDTARGYGAVLFLHGRRTEDTPRGGFRIIKERFAELTTLMGRCFDAAKTGG